MSFWCLLRFLSEREKSNFNSFDDLFNNYPIETHIYDSRTDDVGSQDEKSPNFDIEDLPLPYYGTFHTTDDSSKIAEKEEAESDPLQSLFPYYNNTSPVQSEFEIDDADEDSALNKVNILKGSFVFPMTEVKSLLDVPEIKEPNAKISDDKFEEFISFSEVPPITQSFEPPKLQALTESLVLVDDPDIKEPVEPTTKISEDEFEEFMLIPELEVETIVMDPEELIEVIGKDENKHILEMIMNDGIEIIEIEPEPLDQSLFKMDKDEEFLNESSSRGDRDLSEEMIRIEDHILLPFYDL